MSNNSMEPILSRYIHLISAIIAVACAFFLGLLKYTPLKLDFSVPSIIFSSAIAFFAFILSEILIQFVRSAYYLRFDVETAIYRIIHNYPQKLLAKERENEKSIEDAFEELVELRDKRGMAFDFAIDSFQKILSRGFVIFEESIDKYIEFLIKGISSSKRYILATCTVRPFWFLVDPMRGRTGEITRIGFEHRATHLKPFRDESSKARKVRIVVLEIEEISRILNDTVRQLVILNPPNKRLDPQLSEIPEIEWFQKEANDHPKKVKLFWTIKPDMGLLMEIGDQMLFDGEVSLQFRFTDETEAMGHVILSWKSIIGQNILNGTNEFLEKLDNYLSQKRFDALGHLIFTSFSEMIKHIETLNIPEFTVDEILKDVPTNIRTLLASQNTISELHTYIVEKLNSGELLFPKVIEISFLIPGRNVIQRECQENGGWEDNWNIL